MFTQQHIEEAIAENVSLATQWEQYAVELHLEDASEEDIDLCLDEARLHWEWYSLWCNRLAIAQEWAEYDGVFEDCDEDFYADEARHLDYQYGYVHA